MAERDVAFTAEVRGREAGSVRPGIVGETVNSVLGFIIRVSSAGVRFVLVSRQPGAESADQLIKINDRDPMVATNSWSRKVRSQGPVVEPSRLAVVSTEVSV